MSFFTAIDATALSLLPFPDSAFLLSAFSAITHLGDIRAITVVALSLAIVLWRRGKHAYWASLAVAVGGASSTSWALKMLLARPRPADALIDVAGYSLPSIHAAAAVALYGSLIFITLRLMHPPHHRIPWAVAFATLAFLICISRIYLGVHYATDVLAGAMTGLVYVYAGYRVLAALTSRRGR